MNASMRQVPSDGANSAETITSLATLCIWGSTISTYALSRVAIALIWLYHGLIPKILFRHSTELELVARGPQIFNQETTILVAGGLEFLLGLSVLLFWKARWPIAVSFLAFAGLLLGSLIIAPGLAVHAFNPVTLTVSAIFFCLIQIREMKMQRTENEWANESNAASK